MVTLYRGGTGIMVLSVENGKILMGERTDGQGWCMAGGKSEDNETPEQCASRELEEEFGIKRAIGLYNYKGQVFAKAMIKGNICNVISKIYSICIFEDEPIKKSDAEFIQLKWFSADEIIFNDNIFIPTLAVLNKFYLTESDLEG